LEGVIVTIALVSLTIGGRCSMPTGLEDVRLPMPENEGPKRALLISAHPDDSEFGAAGTSYLWTKQGWEFYHLICRRVKEAKTRK
jgi:hypothetical protein